MEDVSIRAMTPQDARAVAAIHAATLNDPWGKMGPRFLGIFYQELVQLHELALVASLGSSLVGFAAGTSRPGPFFAAVIRRQAPAMGLASIPALVSRPAMIPRFARGLMKPADARRPSGTATLLFIAVATEAQHRGVGRRLVRSFIREAVQRGATRIDLQTDRLDNDAVNAFYCRLGFRLTGAIAAGRRLVNAYELDVRGFPVEDPPQVGRISDGAPGLISHDVSTETNP